jgi:hypothetical protein
MVWKRQKAHIHVQARRAPSWRPTFLTLCTPPPVLTEREVFTSEYLLQNFYIVS